MEVDYTHIIDIYYIDPYPVCNPWDSPDLFQLYQINYIKWLITIPFYCLRYGPRKSIRLVLLQWQNAQDIKLGSSFQPRGNSWCTRERWQKGADPERRAKARMARNFWQNLRTWIVLLLKSLLFLCSSSCWLFHSSLDSMPCSHSLQLILSFIEHIASHKTVTV